MGYFGNILKKISCCHDWRVIRQVDVYEDWGDGKSDIPQYYKLLLVCDKCGKFKKLKY